MESDENINFLKKFKMKKLTFVLLSITPKEARELIEYTKLHNPDRLIKLRIQEKKVNKFIEIFNKQKYNLFSLGGKSKFGFVNDPIIIDTNVCLYEGRHRITGLSKSREDIVVELFFVLGFDEERKKLWKVFHENNMKIKGRR